MGEKANSERPALPGRNCAKNNRAHGLRPLEHRRQRRNRRRNLSGLAAAALRVRDESRRRGTRAKTPSEPPKIQIRVVLRIPSCHCCSTTAARLSAETCKTCTTRVAIRALGSIGSFPRPDRERRQAHVVLMSWTAKPI
jgi:hypothetical protein